MTPPNRPPRPTRPASKETERGATLAETIPAAATALLLLALLTRTLPIFTAVFTPTVNTDQRKLQELTAYLERAAEYTAAVYIHENHVYLDDPETPDKYLNLYEYTPSGNLKRHKIYRQKFFDEGRVYDACAPITIFTGLTAFSLEPGNGHTLALSASSGNVHIHRLLPCPPTAP